MSEANVAFPKDTRTPMTTSADVSMRSVTTPVPGRSEVADTTLRLAQLKPNGIVLEQSSCDLAAIHPQRAVAIRNVVSRFSVLELDAVDSVMRASRIKMYNQVRSCH